MIQSPAGYQGDVRVKRYLDFYQAGYGVAMLSSGVAFSPLSLFANGEQGAWYDPSDFSTMFQNSAGTTPVTAVEQPVGLLLDKSGRGNHASQSTAASRPVLSARVNQLTYSEQFDNAVWNASSFRTLQVTTNQTTAPDGTVTADKVVEAAAGAGSVNQRVIQNDTSSSAQKTFSVYAKKAERKRIYLFVNGPDDGGWFDLDLGTSGAGTDYPGGATSITPVGNGWYRCSLTPSGASGSNFVQICVITDTATTFDVRVGDGTSGVFIWGADLRVTNVGVNLPAYQRVAAATDYDTSNFPLYLKFDGVDDSLVTGTIDFSATDKMSVFAGVRKLSDSSGHLITELGNVSAGGWYLLPGNYISNSSSFFTFLGRGSAGENINQAVQASGYAAPLTAVLAATGNISGDLNTLRVNKVAAANATGDQGTGNYGNLPLNIGRRNNASLPYNGNLYSLIVRGALSTDAQIASTETWVNGKTGAY